MPFNGVLEEIFPQGRKMRVAAPKKGLGCEYCPLNKVPGINKIFCEVTGKDIFIWGMAPGPEENRAGEEFIGRAGKLLWSELKRVGVRRSDCDIQNVVRCFPADRNEDVWPPLSMRDPTKEEIKCCSIYTKKAIEESQAKLHLVFGEVAQKAMLGAEYVKTKKILWSEKMKANVVCLYHPSYFVRMGYTPDGDQKPNRQLNEFRETLKYAVEKLLGSTDQFFYIKGMEYIGVTNREMAKKAYREIRESPNRVAVDMEWSILRSGRKAMLCCGVSPRAGKAYVFALDHPVEISDEDWRYNWKLVEAILTDPDIRKVFHHGSSDVEAIRKLTGIEVEGFDYDTEFAEYFADPEAKAYGLQSIVDRRYPEFANYKEIAIPEAFTESFLTMVAKKDKKGKLTIKQKHDMARKAGGLNLAQMPWKKIVLYNGADCDITKRAEIFTKKKVNLPLLHIYRDVSFILSKMERFGPNFDYAQHERLEKLYPIRVKRWLADLRQRAGRKEFNPGSPPQVKWLLYDKLRLEMPKKNEWEKENTRADTLELMLDDDPAVKLILDYRRDAKIASTYLTGFKRSADMHNGRLTTKWWLTGTGTGRLSSGKGRVVEEQEKGLVNLQNIVSNAQLQNMVISSDIWRDIYQTWLLNGPFDGKTWEEFADVDVLLGFDEAQFEIRVVAQRSGDEELIACFERNEDIHAEVGYQLTGISKEVLGEECAERVAVKGMHFGIIYGLQAMSLHANICAEYKKRGIKKLPTLAWVQDLLTAYFRRYRKVKAMIEQDKRQAEDLGYVETMLGFRRPINVKEQQELGDAWQGAYWANQAANTPIQGTAHQLLLAALAQLVRQKEKYRLLHRPKMEVHDAMYFFVKLRNIWAAVTQGIELLEKEPVRVVRKEFGIDWRVPLKAEPKAGFRFGVQVKNLGLDKGPKTTWDFLNAWCEKNQKVEKELKEEFRKVREAV